MTRPASTQETGPAEATNRPAGTDGMGEPASAGTACRDTLKSVQSSGASASLPSHKGQP